MAPREARANLLTNPGFESGMTGWANWGWGGSLTSVVDGEGRGGSKALRFDGNGSRALVDQNPPVTPGEYTLGGWVKCAGVGSTRVAIQVEWLDQWWGWLGNSGIGHITGDTDWTYLEGVVAAPAGAAYAAVEMITWENNNGVAWYDDTTFTRVPDPPPAPPVVGAQTPAGREGCLQVTWNPGSLSPGVVLLYLYCETNGIPTDALPRAVVDSAPGSGMVWSLSNGQTYTVAARAGSGDGQLGAMGPTVVAEVSDRQAPRAGWLDAQWQPDGRVRIGWSPHVLDADAATARFRTTGGEFAAVLVPPLAALARPHFGTAPWVDLVTNVPPGTTQIGVTCEDAVPNVSAVTWATIADACPTGSVAPCALWTDLPTAQLQKSAGAPPGATDGFHLTLMRGQARGFQVMVRPDSALAGARVRFDALVHSNGQDRIESRWLAYHFVDYVHLTANSGQTPADEIVWTAPADYPDELSDNPIRDLPAGQTQPIFIRVMAPPDAAPGGYTGTGWLECAAGRRPFTLTADVRDVVLSADAHGHAGQWIRFDLLYPQFGVDDFSEDGWRAVAALAAMLRAHRHNYVMIPWNVIRSWREAGGAFRHDFRDFDRFADTFLAHDTNVLLAVSHIGNRGCGGAWDCDTMVTKSHAYRHLDSAAAGSMDVVDLLLPAIDAHVSARGLLDRFAVHVADEPTAQNVASYRTLSARVKAAAPNLRRIDAILTSDLMGYLEIWVPLLDYLDSWPSGYRAAQAAGNELWYYACWQPQWYYPNRLIDSFAIKPRVLHWVNGTYDTSGYLHWALNWWDVPLTNLDAPGDQWVVWPSDRFIVDSSLRFENEREGIEDWALMYQLREALMRQGLTREAAQDRVEAIACVPVRWATDHPRSWHGMETARREMIGELERALQPFLVSIAPSGGSGITLHWNAYSGITYSVMASADLLASHAGFGTVDVHQGTDGTNQWTDTPAGPHRFYRLARPAPPN